MCHWRGSTLLEGCAAGAAPLYLWTGCFHSPTLPEDALGELWPEDMLLSLWTCYLHSTTFPYGFAVLLYLWN